SDDRSVLPARFGFLPGNPTTAGEVVSSRVFSARLPVVCRQIHDKQPFGMFRGENGMNYTFSTFLLEAILIIFFIKAVYFILRPLRQPRIVCEIIGGMVIGPSMLGRSRNFNYYLFPPIANYIIANLGLLGFFYFLFLTAAKTDVGEIFKAPRKHKYIAAISVLVPIACVGGTGAALKDTMDERLFALVGQKTNVYLLTDETWPKQVSPLVYMSIVGFVTKFISSTAAALFFKVPTRDSLTLGLMMNLRGQIEILLYLHWIDKRMVGLPGYTVMVLYAIVVTGVTAPIISFLYDPTRPYRSSKHRTIQHTPQHTEMGLVLAVSDHETFSGLVTFLDFAYPTKTSPLSIFAIQLMELAGRAQPLFFENEKRRKEEEEEEYEMEEEESARTRSKRIDQVQSAFKLYQKKRNECVTLRDYTAYAPKRHMYQDICELALNKKTAFILLPYQKERLQDAALTELRDSGMLTVNADVLAHTPCSVCIYYEKGRLKNAVARSSMDLQHRRQEPYRFVVLFLGGADNREALHLADRMTENPDITMTVVRFLAYNHEGEDEREKKLDDGVVTWFWVKNESNDRVSYKEVVVKNGAETLAAIQAMNVNDYDLWITGRREGINPKILEGLSTWSEDHQLGVIGDTVAGSVFASEGSVLVVQQQVRNQKGGDGFLNGKFDYKSLVSPWSHFHN
ncbi:PREDICTED: cation/H(+) antiporter 25, partial [Camelina sativa]|uniref:Cation/H(+) antiporter 25 n=1 Tax=Camelina sativa TaxID=90675 RepID=A0ABM0XFH3_CAMSA